MSVPVDMPHNINIQPTPVEKVVEVPKPEPGKTDIDEFSLALANQKDEKTKRVTMDEERSKKKRRDSFNKSNSQQASSDEQESDTQNKDEGTILQQNTEIQNRKRHLDITA